MPFRRHFLTLPGHQDTESKKEKNRRKNAPQELKRRAASAARPGQKPNEGYMRSEAFTLPIERIPRQPSYRYHKAETPERPPVAGPGHRRPGKKPPAEKLSHEERESLAFFRSPVFHQTLRGSTPEKPPKLPKPPRTGNRGPRSPEQRSRRAERMVEVMRLRREHEERTRARGPFFPLGGRAGPDAESEAYFRSEQFHRRLDGPLGPLNDEGH